MLASRILIILFSILLVSCSSYAPLPTDHYYRLARIGSVSVDPKHIAESILVQRFISDGLHHERALLYTSDSSSLELKQYHYHYWIDSPSQMLQEQLADYLRANNVAPVVLTAYEGITEYVIRGQIKQFERNADNVSVRLMLRIDAIESNLPLLQKEYESVIVVKKDSILSVVDAFSVATTDIFDKFLADISMLISRAD